MTNMISNYPTSPYHALPSSSSTTGTTKRQPSPAEAYLHNECEKAFLRVMVCLMMSVFFTIWASAEWQDRHNVIIMAIAFIYSTVMIQLVLTRRWDGEKRQAELEGCQMMSTPGAGLQSMLTSMLMLVATGVAIISLAVALFIFHPAWPDLALIAISVSFSTVLIFCMLGSEENSRKKGLRDASNRV